MFCMCVCVQSSAPAACPNPHPPKKHIKTGGAFKLMRYAEYPNPLHLRSASALYDFLASLRALRGYHPAPRDDLESLCYALLEMWAGAR